MEKTAIAAALVVLIAPEGATDLSLGGKNYPVRNGEVEVPREYANAAYGFGYVNKPADPAVLEAEVERVRQAQAEMDAANAGNAPKEDPALDLAAFLGRDAADVIAELPNLTDDGLTAVEEAEIGGQAREDVAAAIDAERVRRAAG